MDELTEIMQYWDANGWVFATPKGVYFYNSYPRTKNTRWRKQLSSGDRVNIYKVKGNTLHFHTELIIN
jgi:hypothetical protein